MELSILLNHRPMWMRVDDGFDDEIQSDFGCGKNCIKILEEKN